MKSRLILWLILVAPLLYVGCTTKEATQVAVNVKSGTQIAGILPANLVADDYWVYGDLEVPLESTTTIAPGAVLKFDDLGEDLNGNGILDVDAGEDVNGNNLLDKDLFSLIVKGQLIAEGDTIFNITFTSMSGAVGAGDYGQWRGIIFDTQESEAAGKVSKLAFCKILFGASSDTNMRYPEDPPLAGYFVNGAIFLWNSSPTIQNCTIAQNGYHGIYILGTASHPYLVNNTIYNNDGDGIRAEALTFAQPTNIWYNNCKENNGLQFGTVLREMNFGTWNQVNYNRDSCDFQYNLSLEPLFKDEDGGVNDFDSLYSCSACIDAGRDLADPTKTTYIGSVRYDYPYPAHELRRRVVMNSINGGTYYVTCNTFVEAADSFTVQNATLLFDGIYGLDVHGLCQLDNTTLAPNPAENAADRWLGIHVMETADPNTHIIGCTLEMASTAEIEVPYGGAITVRGVAIAIQNDTLRLSQYGAISCFNASEPTIVGNVIDGFGTVGINCYDNSSPLIQRNVIRQGTGYGIWCSFSSSPIIKENLIYSNLQIGIRCENQSNPDIYYNTLAYNGYGGIHCVSQCNPDVQDNVLAFNGALPTGMGITAWGSSFFDPLTQIQYNDVYQPANAGPRYTGISPLPDATNLNLNPAFVDSASGNLRTENAALNTASSVDGPIGAYALGWNPPTVP